MYFLQYVESRKEINYLRLENASLLAELEDKLDYNPHLFGERKSPSLMALKLKGEEINLNEEGKKIKGNRDIKISLRSRPNSANQIPVILSATEVLGSSSDSLSMHGEKQLTRKYEESNRVVETNISNRNIYSKFASLCPNITKLKRSKSLEISLNDIDVREQKNFPKDSFVQYKDGLEAIGAPCEKCRENNNKNCSTNCCLASMNQKQIMRLNTNRNVGTQCEEVRNYSFLYEITLRDFFYYEQNSFILSYRFIN